MSHNITKKISLDEKAVRALAAAIVKQACIDYLKFHKRKEKLLKKDPSKMRSTVTVSKWKYEVKYCDEIIAESRDFLLNSDYYEQLCDINPKKILEHLDELIKRGKYSLAKEEDNDD